ncbi:rop guanine nucleotide exchange factor 12-like [Impatiens glandulifera]|uniref:rop guanine nucleotide exchange factor 12-like n=1 Tax=Impatiens glandulifera TaxID=253017 RepID=UPI001FB085FC|nr:rop guanine nucleotide exchange factor 12-like [Impatiens glandulifera]
MMVQASEDNKGSKSRSPTNEETIEHLIKSMELMKEKFSKLLLGEDMSGGGKGVSSALALSNAITNLAASVFGEQRRLEPMAADTKARWRKEIDWLLSVTDQVVEMVPSRQIGKDGTNMEIMTTRKRKDLLVNIPALRKLDAMLIDCLDNFKDQNEFTYVSKDSDDSKRKVDKWWIPTPKVPPNGLPDVTRKWLLYQKDSVNQALKAAMAINAQVISEMEIPENYLDSLPKNGRSSLGESIYKSITVDSFDPDNLLSTMDLSADHKILDLKNRIEASIIIWKRKMNAKEGKSGWGSAVSLEKRELFEERAETILLIIKHRFPGVAQSALEVSKIQYNKDVGQSILESYSRIIESLAFTVLSRIEDVLHADSVARDPSVGEKKRATIPHAKGLSKFPNAKEELEKLNMMATPKSMTLVEFADWQENKGSLGDRVDLTDEVKLMVKLANIDTNRRFSYAENLGVLRSPTARH